MEAEKNNKGLLVTIIVILSILVVGLSIYIIYDKILSKDKTTIIDKTDEKTGVSNNDSNKKLNQDDSIVPELEDNETLAELYFKVFYELNTDTEDANLLSNDNNRTVLTKQLLNEYQKDSVIYDSEIHNEIIGFYYVEKTLFDNYYKEITNIEFTSNKDVTLMTYSDIEKYADKNDFGFDSTLLDSSKKYYRIVMPTGYGDMVDSTEIIENKIDENGNTIITIEFTSKGIIQRLHVTISNKVYRMTIEQ